MSHLGYIIPRMIRRYVPSPIVTMAKRLRLGIVPGLETRHPIAAADRYEAVLHANGRQWDGMCVLILGYGGFLGTGVELLDRGASHVILVDPFAQIDDRANQKLAEKYHPYLSVQGKNVIPKEDWITVVHDEISNHDFSPYPPIDIFLSSSVLEHVSSLDPLISGLSKMTHSEGFHTHYVDLRDHYFKYPFEMYCFSEKTWNTLLDPPSHLNRLRIWDYEAYFSRYFHQVGVEIIEKDIFSFTRTKSRIRPNYLSGNDKQDCATKILITATYPRNL
jgi:hypothetical protein